MAQAGGGAALSSGSRSLRCTAPGHRSLSPVALGMQGAALHMYMWLGARPFQSPESMQPGDVSLVRVLGGIAPVFLTVSPSISVVGIPRAPAQPVA